MRRRPAAISAIITNIFHTIRYGRRFRRLMPLLTIGVVLVSWHLPFVARPQEPAPPPPGLRIGRQQSDENSPLLIRSADRFEFLLDDSGIVEWYDLQRDPQRKANLVASGAHLLEHRFIADGALTNAKPVVLEDSPVRSRIAWASDPSDTARRFRIEYTIWAAGQIAVQVQADEATATTLHRDERAITGAALDLETPVSGGDGTTTQTALLFLDAWTPEDSIAQANAVGAPEAQTPAAPAQSDPPVSTENPPLPTAALAQQPTPISQPEGAPLAYNDLTGAITLAASPDQPTVASLPLNMALRQPRFELSGWTSPELTVKRDDTVLVEGQDYLTAWNQAEQLLVVQYMYPLPASSEKDVNTFSFAASASPVTLSLSIAGKTLDENGMLIVDANFPDRSGTMSTPDLFTIPYIQSVPAVTVQATLQNAPADSGVKFVLRLAGGATQESQDFSAPYQATFTMPQKGEHQLEAYVLDVSGQPVNTTPDDNINPVGYGNIFVSIGDSITAGEGGNRVTSSNSNFPVTSYLRSPIYSADRRNIYQYNNTQASSEAFYQGYEVQLNDHLTACSSAPIFVLNEGFGGLRTARLNNRNALGKQAYYNDHINKLGAKYVLLQIGTNDVSNSLDPALYEGDLNQVVDALQAPNPGLGLWVARLPWRNDSGTALTQSYNQRISSVVSQQNVAVNPVWLGPDFYSYFAANPSQLTDNLHPNQTGYNAMASLWSTPVCNVLTNPPTIPTATASPVVTSTPSATNTVQATATSVPQTPGTLPAWNEGLSSYWRLDEDSASTRPPYQDSIGSNPATTCSGSACPLPVAGIVSGAQQFNGASGLNVPSSAVYNWPANGSFSIALWMRAVPGQTCVSGNQVIVGRDESASGLHWWVGCLKGGASSFYLRDSSGSGSGVSGPSLTDGTWHQVVAVRDGAAGMNRLYVDGVQVAAGARSYTATFGSNTAALNLGWLNRSSGYRYQGTLDEVAVYGRALSASEVSAFYAHGLAGRDLSGTGGVTVTSSLLSATSTPEPTATSTPEPTATSTPEPTATSTPEAFNAAPPKFT